MPALLPYPSMVSFDEEEMQDFPIFFGEGNKKFRLTSDGEVAFFDTADNRWKPTRLSVDLKQGQCYLDLDSFDSEYVAELVPAPYYGLPQIARLLIKKNKLFK